MSVSTHVLDSTVGTPAAAVAVSLQRRESGQWQQLATGVTDLDGRVPALAESTEPGDYRLTFDVGAYFASREIDTFYPEVTVTFRITSGDAHYHVPLLLSAYSYATYRGS
ncbi:5-hydroxyisourate hydrolase [Tamaricihabitans halophyticus]|uniref:5-hydroxyisourate hydrolase n=1 Tax=Tamaricihabitans halophyticus TaxID=1262583 RepID=A0A4R2R4T1_9PSEU|nr:hydroxyisourate hydrolase [Tamaricihabitans halophyticus]TCP56934.1 5-hydroxyisourate hydrolase [Tamaricihabitans halophyticus]